MLDVSRPLLADTRYCLDCSQSLRGVTEAVCPECGRRFDPLDPTTTGDVPFPMRRVLGRLAKGLAMFGIAATAIVVLLAAWGGSVLLVWLIAFALAPLLLGGLILALIPAILLSRRWRLACIVVPLIVASVVFTDWPFRLVFELHRARFDAAVAAIEAGGGTPPTGPMQIGLYRILAVQKAQSGDLGFKINGRRGGGVFLVHPAFTGTAPWFNTNWERDLGGGWWRVEQD